MRKWADERHALSFKVIQAEGGVGKTRLAAEFAQSLLDTRRWKGGFVSLATFERTGRLAWQRNTIIVVDYPEHSPERLTQLIAAAKEGLHAANKNQKLRILLLCRSQEAVNDLLSQQGATSFLSNPILLGELAGKGNLNLLNQSLSKLAPNAPSVTQQEFQVWLDQSSLHKTALFVVALAIHLSSAPAPSSRFLPGAQLLQALLKREQARWAKAEQGHGLAHGTLADVVAFAALFNGLPVGAVNTKLNDAYNWPDGYLSKVHNALGEVWPVNVPAQTYPAMAPDLLAAALLWQWQGTPAKRGVPTDANLLASLVPANQAETNELLQRWHMQAYDQTTRLQLGLPQDPLALAGLLQNAAASNAGLASRLKLGFLTQTNWAAFADLAANLSKPSAAVLGESNANEEVTAKRAAELHNHAVHLAATGDRPGALIAAQEAVGIYKRLAKNNPAAYEPNLAMSINNLANHLIQTGDRPSALIAAQEAVDIRRRLAKTNLAAYEPDLAMSISNLANHLSQIGDHPGALIAALEAVDIRRRLANTNPAAYEPVLAESINNLANRLSQTGDRPGALKAAQEAVDIRRRLAKTNLAAYEPDLAGSIGNLANRLSETGDRPGALIAAQEAVDIYRRLAKNNPAAYEPNLAMSIGNLANHVSKTGDRPGALIAAQEAVALFEKVSQQTPGAFDRQLAIARRVLARLTK